MKTVSLSEPNPPQLSGLFLISAANYRLAELSEGARRLIGGDNTTPPGNCQALIGRQRLGIEPAGSPPATRLALTDQHCL